MTELLEKAIAKARELSPEAQDQLAARIFAEIESEERWQKAFDDSADVLAQIADEVLAAHRAGKTTRLHLDDL